MNNQTRDFRGQGSRSDNDLDRGRRPGPRSFSNDQDFRHSNSYSGSNNGQGQVNAYRSFQNRQSPPPTHPCAYPPPGSGSVHNFGSGYQSSQKNAGLVPRQSHGLLGAAPPGALAQQGPLLSRQHQEAMPMQAQQKYLQNSQLQLSHTDNYPQQGILPTQYPVPNRDTNPKVSPSMVSKLSPDDLLKNFRSLECSGCQRHFGYQSRKDKNLVYCNATCLDQHADCLPTVDEEVKPQAPVAGLPSPVMTQMPPEQQPRPIQQAVSSGQGSGYGAPRMMEPQQGFRNNSFSSSMPALNQNDYRNGPKSVDRDPAVNGVNRQSSAPRSNTGYQRDRQIEGDRGGNNRNNYNNGTSNGYVNRDRTVNRAGGGGGGGGGSAAADRRSGPLQGKKVGEKSPFMVPDDDDKEWPSADVVDRRVGGVDRPSTTLAPRPTPRPKSPSPSRAQLKPNPPGTLIAKSPTDKPSATVQKENIPPQAAKAPCPAVPKQMASTAPPIPTPQTLPATANNTVKVLPSRLLSELTDAVAWTPLQIGVPLHVSRNFVNATGDFFVQAFDISQQGKEMADGIKSQMDSGCVTQLRKFPGKTLCLAPFEGTYYRGEILGPAKDPPGQIDVFFSDYGNIESVGSDVICELPSVLATTPRLISHCLWDLALSKEFPETQLAKMFEDERLPILPKMEVAPGQYLVQIGQYVATTAFELEEVVTHPETSVPPRSPVQLKPATAPAHVTPARETPLPEPTVEGSPPNAESPTPVLAEEPKVVQPPQASPTVAVPDVQVTAASPMAVAIGGTTITQPHVDVGVTVTSPSSAGGAARFTGVRPVLTKALPPGRKKFMMKDLDFAPTIQPSENVTIAYAWGPIRYLVVGNDHATEGDKIQALIAQQRGLCTKLKPDELPEVGEVLLGPYDGDYYRGVVEKVDLNAKTAILEFIDFGDKAEIKFDDIFVPNAAMMAVPALGLSLTLPKVESIPGINVSGCVTDYMTQPMQLQLFDPCERLKNDIEAALWISNEVTLNAVIHRNT